MDRPTKPRHPNPSSAVVEHDPPTHPLSRVLEDIRRKYGLGPLKLYREGGMCSVYRGHVLATGQSVAVKVPNTLVPDKHIRQERRVLHAVHHQNVVRIIDADDLCVIMEFLDGITIAEKLNYEPFTDIADVFEISIQIAEGLLAVHEKDITHHDLKPSNVMLLPQDTNELDRTRWRVKILDFGVATTGPNYRGEPATRTIDDGRRRRIGTEGYRAPECWNIRGGTNLPSSKADVYSFGCLIYELCTGRPPFLSGEPAILEQYILDSDNLPRGMGELRPDAPHELAQLVSRMIANLPTERPPVDYCLQQFRLISRQWSENRTQPHHGICPFPGLRPYQQIDSYAYLQSAHQNAISRAQTIMIDLLGNQAQNKELEDLSHYPTAIWLLNIFLLDKKRWLRIEGSALSGKSSFLTAGLATAIEQHRIEFAGYVRDPIVVQIDLLHESDGCSAFATRISAALKLNIDIGGLGASIRAKDDNAFRFLQKWTRGHRQNSIFLLIDHFEIMQEYDEPTRHAIDKFLSRIIEDEDMEIFLISARRTGNEEFQKPLPRLSQLHERAMRYSMPTEFSIEELLDWANQALARTNSRFDPDALLQLRADISRTTINLPAISLTLREWWYRRQNGRLTLKLYREIGGIHGCLNKICNMIWEQFSITEQTRAERLLLSLIQTKLGHHDTTRSLDMATALLIAGGDSTAEIVIERLCGAENDNNDEKSRRPTILTKFTSLGLETNFWKIRIGSDALFCEWRRLAELVSNNRHLLTRRDLLESIAANMSKFDDFADNPTKLSCVGCLDLSDQERYELFKLLTLEARQIVDRAAQAVKALSDRQEPTEPGRIESLQELLAREEAEHREAKQSLEQLQGALREQEARLQEQFGQERRNQSARIATLKSTVGELTKKQEQIDGRILGHRIAIGITGFLCVILTVAFAVIAASAVRHGHSPLDIFAVQWSRTPANRPVEATLSSPPTPPPPVQRDIQPTVVPKSASATLNAVPISDPKKEVTTVTTSYASPSAGSPESGPSASALSLPDKAVTKPVPLRAQREQVLIREMTYPPAKSEFYAKGGVMIFIKDDSQISGIEPFLIDQLEVSVRTYYECVQEDGCPNITSEIKQMNPEKAALCNWMNRDDRWMHPINCISPQEADQVCRWAHKRLPTDREWRFAAVGNMSWRLPWGNSHPDVQDICWHQRQFTCEVDDGDFTSLDKSVFNVLGMAGNVSELTSSKLGSARLFRGGSFGTMTIPRLLIDEIPTEEKRVIDRGLIARQNNVGVRCAADASQASVLKRKK